LPMQELLVLLNVMLEFYSTGVRGSPRQPTTFLIFHSAGVAQADRATVF
jgi:hypothetical protein